MPVKGQTLSAVSIEKMKQSKLQRIVSKYNWIIIDPYMDVEIKNGSVKRTNQYITLREFRENIEEGMSQKDMSSIGISKKVIQFFSNFCQGKIKLTKEQFLEDYKAGESLEEICAKYGVTREDLTYLRQLYDIKRKGATYINRKKTEVPLTHRQKDILYGSLMGDAKRQHSKFNSSAGFVQGAGQVKYLEWKYSIFENIATPKGIKKHSQYDKRYDKRYESYRFYTTANSDVEEIITQFYGGKEKQITTMILDNLTSLSVAVWFMDDGYADKNKTGISNFIFCTDSFSEKSIDNIVKWFDDKWGIKTHKRERKLKDRMGYRVVVKAESVNDFIDLIRPHIIHSMLYKIGEK